VGKNCCHSSIDRFLPAAAQARLIHLFVRVSTVQVLPSVEAMAKVLLSGR